MTEPTGNICLTQSQMQAIADALGHTTEGLTGPDIEHLLTNCKINDCDPANSKRKRLYNAFAEDQNKRGHRRNILEFIRRSMKPERFLRCRERFEPLRANLNQALLFAGLYVTEAGLLEKTDVVETLSGAHRRAQELRADLAVRGVHADVLRFCREELLADNYFHAVLEAVKSVMVKLRVKSGLTADGNALIDQALAGDSPVVMINRHSSESEKSEQKGFANLVRGMTSMFRNTTAHEPRIAWPIEKEDAEDIFSLISLIHRRLDSAIRRR